MANDLLHLLATQNPSELRAAVKAKAPIAKAAKPPRVVLENFEAPNDEPIEKINKRKVVLKTKACPHGAGHRAKLWRALKSGMTVEQARAVGIPQMLNYLRRMDGGPVLDLK